MPVYTYAARDETGRIQRGTQEAASPAALRSALQSRGLQLMRVQRRRNSQPVPRSGPTVKIPCPNGSWRMSATITTTTTRTNEVCGAR